MEGVTLITKECLSLPITLLDPDLIFDKCEEGAEGFEGSMELFPKDYTPKDVRPQFSGLYFLLTKISFYCLSGGRVIIMLVVVIFQSGIAGELFHNGMSSSYKVFSLPKLIDFFLQTCGAASCFFLLLT